MMILEDAYIANRRIAMLYKFIGLRDEAKTQGNKFKYLWYGIVAFFIDKTITYYQWDMHFRNNTKVYANEYSTDVEDVFRFVDLSEYCNEDE